jgi:SAM-dependent methyltransferase
VLSGFKEEVDVRRGVGGGQEPVVPVWARATISETVVASVPPGPAARSPEDCIVRSSPRAPANMLAAVVPREVSTDLSMLERLVDPHGWEVVDIGCGAGALARALAVAGAQVVALKVSEEQLAPALAGDDGGGVRYLVGRAQALPLEDGSVDVAVFMRALHHVPVEDMRQALQEARRVVRPGGAIYVAEPLTEGDFWALTSMIEDESEARDAAHFALAKARDVGLEPVITVE